MTTYNSDRPWFVSFQEPTKPEQDAQVRLILDKGYKAMRQMIKTHEKDDIIAFIACAQDMEEVGYTMLWYKEQHILAARRKTDGRTITRSDGEVDQNSGAK
jgi:hypothetical protein